MARDVIKHLGQLFQDGVRYIYSGLLAIILWRAGHPALMDSTAKPLSDINQFQLWWYSALTVASGIGLYVLSRYILSDILLQILSKGKDSPYRRGDGDTYITRTAHYLLFRFGPDFPNRLADYIVARWGWTHVLCSMGLVLTSMPWVADTGSILSLRRLGGLSLFLGILFFYAWVHQTKIAVRVERLLFNERSQTMGCGTWHRPGGSGE